MKINIVITGYDGKMGQAIIQQLSAFPSIKLIGVICKKSNYLKCQKLSEKQNINLSTPNKIFPKSDIIIDFTSPQASKKYALLASKYNKRFVCGTTGFDNNTMQIIKKLGTKIPIFYTSNTSIGIALLTKLAKTASKMLDHNFDIEIIEMHHNQKKDAPSGTALSLGKEIALSRNIKHEIIKPRWGNIGERPKGHIGYSVLRGGSVPGWHEIVFSGKDEQIKISHNANSRSIFAKGALKIAKWLYRKPPSFYQMNDLFK